MSEKEFIEEVGKRLKSLGVAIGICKHCQLPVYFFKTRNDKWHLSNLDLTSHFVSCEKSPLNNKK